MVDWCFGEEIEAIIDNYLYMLFTEIKPRTPHYGRDLIASTALFLGHHKLFINVLPQYGKTYALKPVSEKLRLQAASQQTQ